MLVGSLFHTNIQGHRHQSFHHLQHVDRQAPEGRELSLNARVKGFTAHYPELTVHGKRIQGGWETNVGDTQNTSCSLRCGLCPAAAPAWCLLDASGWVRPGWDRYPTKGEMSEAQLATAVLERMMLVPKHQKNILPILFPRHNMHFKRRTSLESRRSCSMIAFAASCHRNSTLLSISDAAKL